MRCLLLAGPFASHAESCGGAPHRLELTGFTIRYLYLYQCTCIVVVGDKHTPRVPAKAFIIIIIIISKEQESNLKQRKKIGFHMYG